MKDNRDELPDHSEHHKDLQDSLIESLIESLNKLVDNQNKQIKNQDKQIFNYKAITDKQDQIIKELKMRVELLWLGRLN